MNPVQQARRNELIEGWASLLGESPNLGQAAGASRLGVSEAELVAAHVAKNSVRLATDWTRIFGWIAAMGRVSSLTRNDRALIDQIDRYDRLDVRDGQARLGGGDSSLLVRLEKLHVAFAVIDERRAERRRSLQFFDRAGRAVHKTFLRDSGVREFDARLRLHESDDQSPLEALPVPEASACDGAGLRHVHTLQALGPSLAEQVPTTSCRALLRWAVDTHLALTTAVVNSAVEQRHEGLVRSSKANGSWLALKAPGHNARVDLSGIASAWLLRAPNTSLASTRLECCDAEGHLIFRVAAQETGARVERERWLGFVDELERAPRVRICRDIAS
jgi:putative hemin transport protein